MDLLNLEIIFCLLVPLFGVDSQICGRSHGSVVKVDKNIHRRAFFADLTAIYFVLMCLIIERLD